MVKKSIISDEDAAVFRQAGQGAKPLLHSKMDIQPNLKVQKRKATITEELPTAPLSDYQKQDTVSIDQMIQFNQPGIPHKTLRNLRAGQYNVDAILDLHGMTVMDAKEALYHFLLRCQDKGCRFVLIIHGKGRSVTKPILKNMLNNWLRQLEQVLAFCSAAAKDGRSGALYVLLKQQKKEKNFDR
jgi:DNA-nicking Smr family endonuclease